MKCVICRNGETRPGEATVTLHRGSATVIVKGVPAEICENCGEHYLSEQIAERVLSEAENAVAKGTEVEIRRFAA
jgi:YgiT-type zinc finger domain-containing protein